MKTKLFFIALLVLGFGAVEAQSQTTVYAKNSDISDNLDLRAVASIFGESVNLEDFERRLNDPKYQISNLDLNDDNQVDYLRVVETVEHNTHVIIIQSVLDRDVFQDVATIDVERDNNNKISVQVVGNAYLYGANYIYEPVYHVRPIIYTSFWVPNYRPYYSSWTWNYYPSYYYAWRPFPIFRYRNNVNVYINVHNHYNYVTTRRSYRAPVLYESRRTYGYETRRPNYSFAQRHSNTTNRYELEQRRVESRQVNRNQNSYSNKATAGINRNSGNNTDRTFADNRGSNTRNYSGSSQTAKSNTRDINSVKTDNSARRNNNTVASPATRNASQGNNESRVFSGSSSRSNSATTPTATPKANTSRSNSAAPATSSMNSQRPSVAKPQNTQRSQSVAPARESRNNSPAQRDSGSNARAAGRRG
jgi:hypothetical protein